MAYHEISSTDIIQAFKRIQAGPEAKRIVTDWAILATLVTVLAVLVWVWGVL